MRQECHAAKTIFKKAALEEACSPNPLDCPANMGRNEGESRIAEYKLVAERKVKRHD